MVSVDSISFHFFQNIEVLVGKRSGFEQPWIKSVCLPYNMFITHEKMCGRIPHAPHAAQETSANFQHFPGQAKCSSCPTSACAWVGGLGCSSVFACDSRARNPPKILNLHLYAFVSVAGQTFFVSFAQSFVRSRKHLVCGYYFWRWRFRIWCKGHARSWKES